MHAMYSCALKKSLACHIHFPMATNEAVRTPAVEDYTKAIFSLESRRDEPVSTKTLAERLGITPDRSRRCSSASTSSA